MQFDPNNEPVYSIKGRRYWWGIALENGKYYANLGSVWRTAHIMGASFIATIGERYHKQPSDTGKFSLHLPLFHYKDFADFREHQPVNSNIIGVELCDRAIPLEKFGWQAYPRPIIVLGAEDYGLSEQAKKQCRKIVKLPGDISNNVANIASMVVWDYHLKTFLNKSI